MRSICNCASILPYKKICLSLTLLGSLALTLLGGYNLIASTNLSKWTFALNIALACGPTFIGIITVLICYYLWKKTRHYHYSINRSTGEVITYHGRIIVQADGVDIFNKHNLLGYHFDLGSQSINLKNSRTRSNMVWHSALPENSPYTLEDACRRGIVKIYVRKVKISRSNNYVDELLQLTETDKQGNEVCLSQFRNHEFDLHSIKPMNLDLAQEKLYSLSNEGRNSISIINVFFCPWKGIICACVIKNESPTWMIFWSDLDQWLTADKLMEYAESTTYNCRSFYFTTMNHDREFKPYFRDDDSFQQIPVNEIVRYQVQQKTYEAIPSLPQVLSPLIAGYVI